MFLNSQDNDLNILRTTVPEVRFQISLRSVKFWDNFLTNISNKMYVNVRDIKFLQRSDKNCPLVRYFVTGTSKFVPKELQLIAKK
jgi:hypothetical protein